MKTRVLFALLGLCAANTFGQTLQVAPAGPVLNGTPLTVSMSGLAAGAEVQIVAERLVRAENGRPQVYRSEAHFKADGSGKLDLADAAPLSGSYRGADKRGLFWSMVPTATSVPGDWKINQVYVSAMEGGKEIGRTTIEFINALPDVAVEPVEQFAGAVFAHLPGAVKRPAIIVLGGSEGGSAAARDAAPRLASRGYAVLGLPYYSPAAWGQAKRELPSLPQSFVDIPVDRLDEVYAWLKTRPDVDTSRIALLGASKGAEFSLIAASKMKWITSVVAIVPSDVVWMGWGPDVAPGTERSSFSYQGKALPFVPNKDFPQELAGFQTGAEVRFRRPQDKGRAANPAAAVAARIRVEDFKGPLLVAGGIEDQMWASGMMAQNIAERRAEAGLETVTLVYTDAGHLLTGSGYNPTTQYNAGPNKMGGTPEANARAQAEIWEATMNFLARTLGQPKI